MEGKQKQAIFLLKSANKKYIRLNLNFLFFTVYKTWNIILKLRKLNIYYVGKVIIIAGSNLSVRAVINF